MQRRSYNQACPLAYALDKLGGRWTLLIIRELLYGPRRFKDLLTGLPGIGTNLLAERLKILEHEKLISRDNLPPPAGSAVYGLTGKGQTVIPIIEVLATWGMPLMVGFPDSDYLGAITTMSSLGMLFAKQRVENPILCEIHTQDEVFTASITRKNIDLTPGLNAKADLVFRVEAPSILHLLGHPVRAAEALKSGAIEIEKGDPSHLQSFLQSFYNLEEGADFRGPT